MIQGPWVPVPLWARLFHFCNSRFSLLATRISPYKWNQSTHTPSYYPVLEKGSLEKIWLPIPVVYNFSCQLKHPYIYLLIAPASFRPYSVVNFSHFRLLLWNCWMGFNETWQEARSQRALPILWFFSGEAKKQDGRPGIWLAVTFSTFLLKPLNRIQGNLTGSNISMSSSKYVFRADRKNKMAALASDWLRHFSLLLWNCWTEFN